MIVQQMQHFCSDSRTLTFGSPPSFLGGGKFVSSDCFTFSAGLVSEINTQKREKISKKINLYMVVSKYLDARKSFLLTKITANLLSGIDFTDWLC